MKICKFTIDSEGTQFWHNKNDLLHREGDKPAIIRKDGYKAWYKNGNLHRDNDLPAVIWANGDQSWWKDGKRHREGDQPAIIYTNGDQYWYKDGNQISEEEAKSYKQNKSFENSIIEVNGEKFKLVKV